ncbi:SMI1/KNR4 family protein [Snuella lapsa]|uniref:Knr4/Smi1-like domain-containing protein n=1 Tax=Snuella lapsa TaxID=870481 RepID=A0ABP6X5T7_9FLAO
MEIFEEFINKYNRNESLVKATDLELNDLESEFNIVLPNDYKLFIKSYGDVWTPSILDIIVDNDLELNDIQDFWSIEKIIYDKKNEWTSQLSTDLIPFASDCMGSIFGFLTSNLKQKNENSSVYFFDHDLNTVEKISNSFTDWIYRFNKL